MSLAFMGNSEKTGLRIREDAAQRWPRGDTDAPGQSQVVAMGTKPRSLNCLLGAVGRQFHLETEFR